MGYLPDRKQKQKKQEKKEMSFKMLLDAEMEEDSQDESRSFQLYC